VPRALIIWLAHAVNVVRPADLRLHIDRVRFAKGGRLGDTLGNRMLIEKEYREIVPIIRVPPKGAAAEGRAGWRQTE
jgi:hypothetical protein